jgi:hypothetical protein
VYKDICPYNKYKDCYGAKSDRKNEFLCEFVDESGNIETDMDKVDFTKLKDPLKL